MSSKDPQRQQRKRNLFRLIDSFVPENIDMALQLIKADQGLYQAAKQRYYSLMRLVDPKLGGGFRLLHAVAIGLKDPSKEEISRGFIAHYAKLGDREMVEKTLRLQPASIRRIEHIALLNMLCTMQLPQGAEISWIALKDEATPLEIPDDWDHWATCKKLACGNQAQYLAFLPHIAKFLQLDWIDFTGCQLETLADEFAAFTNLIFCELYQNRFVQLPEQLRAFKKLSFLGLKDNRLQDLPAWLAELPGLKHLLLDNNSIRKLPDFIFALPKLSKLSLDGNKLTQLPNSQEFSNTKLRQLLLSHNPLNHFPTSILSLVALEQLEMNNCGLTELPAEIGQLEKLSQLSLRNNPMTALPDDIGSLVALQSLDLRACPLDSLPAAFGKLSALQSLDLRGTKINVLPTSFQLLGNLSSLWLNRPDPQTQQSQTQQMKAWLPNCKVEFA